MSTPTLSSPPKPVPEPPERRERAPWLPPPWVIRRAWFLHRRIYRVTRGRGLWLPKQKRWGAMRVTTIGRRTGQERGVILGYVEDGQNLVTMAMNGWMPEEPAWWLNLQADPHARVTTVDGTCDMIARAATGDERERLWDRWRSIDKGLDEYAARRPRETAVVVFEPSA